MRDHAARTERVAARREFGVDRVFAPLLVPGRLPVRPLAQARLAVAQGGEEGDGLLGHQLRDQRV